jgi:hypothetical protein
MALALLWGGSYGVRVLLVPSFFIQICGVVSVVVEGIDAL